MGLETNIKISAFIINHNDSRYLPEQLNSIIGQQKLPDELIFADDGSSDESIEIAEFYRSEFEEIQLDYRIHREEKNSGICKIANTAAKLAKFDLIHGGCSTDRFLPDFFLKQSEAFSRYPSAGLAFSDPYHFTDSGGMNPNSFNLGSDYIYFSPEDAIGLLKFRAFISGFTTVYKRELWEKYGGLREEFEHHSDWLLNLRIILETGCVYVPGPIAQTRWRAEGYAERGVNSLPTQKRVLDRISAECKIDTALRDFIVATDSCRWLGPHQNILRNQLC